jgi:ADP-heptose:LPS heptosyltransferase
MLRLLHLLRRERFDATVYLAPRLRAPVHVKRDLLFFSLARIKHFIAHHGFKPLPLPSADGHLPSTEHEADHLLYRLSLSGIPVPSPGKGIIDLKLDQSELEQGRTWIAQNIPQSDAKLHHLVAIGPGSKWQSKIWPEERFIELGRRLIRDLGILPIVMGGLEDNDLGNRLVKEWGQGVVAAGKLTVRESAAVLKYCRAYVGNDTGAMHLAAAVNTKCIAIFSAQDWPGRWYPYGEGHRVIRYNVPCEGCMLSTCVKEGKRCLVKIDVDDVLDACRSAWASD